jgi:hypothetical protein
LIAERLNLRVFVDGIEIPALSANATFSEGAPATCDIQVIATDEVYDILPRAFVTVFVYNSDPVIQEPKSGQPTLKVGPDDVRRWELLFAGEFVAVGMEKSASSRSAVLRCVDTTNYFDFIRQHYINFRNGGVELFESAFMGVRQDRLKFFDVVTQGVHSQLYIWLTQSKNQQGKPSLFLGVQRMLREMFFSVNSFYAEAYNRTRIGDTIVGLSEDETAAKLFDLQFFEKFIKNQVGGAGGMVTARQLTDLLLGPVFHTYVTVPFPRFDRSGSALGLAATESEEGFSAGTIERTTSWPGASLNATVIKPDTWFLAPPACNIIFPHQYTTLSYGRDYLAEPTRLFLRTSLIFTGQDKWLTERFYAPDFEAFNSLLYAEGGYLDRMSKTLLPHEEYVGLNPAEVWQADIAAYVQKGARREYFSYLADYMFWKYKYGTRTVNGAGPLNRNLVPGYPALVMDRVTSNTGVTRHFFGNLATVVHSVDQQGGWTHWSMAGARLHTESFDLDSQGRYLEELATRATDGFLDDRYDPERIGDEVYQSLFGCGSLVDVADTSREDDSDLYAGLVADQGELALKSPLMKSVVALEYLYRAVSTNGGDVRGFSRSVSWRPRANFAETMGIRHIIPRPQGDQPAFGYGDLKTLFRSDPDLEANPNGFFATAVTTEAPETFKAFYEEDGTTGRYELDSHLRARQVLVRKYVDSLRLRGMRG